MKKICKTLSNSPTEVSGRKCLKLGLSEFLSLLNSLPKRKSCTSAKRLQEHRCEMLGFSTKNSECMVISVRNCISYDN